MKRRITLYIDGAAADLADDKFVLMNYAVTDLANPTAVRNSYSQTIQLPRTPANDRIFGAAFRVDRINGAGTFNPRLRSPFIIFDADGTHVESGYVKLNAVSRDGYDVTLYGGLGSLLYGMSYDANGDALTLADLDFLATGTPASELDFTINRTTLLGAWQDLEQPGQATIFGVVNFAPAYNGIPDGDFAADKCLFDPDILGIGDLNPIAKLSRKYTEREMVDYRSYLQRPVLNVSKTLDALVRFAAGLGYTLDLTGWDYAGNTFVEDTWMTLPMLKDKRSGDTITKADLLGGTMSPAAFLLGIVKTFGLLLVCDHDKVSLVKRDDFFEDVTTDLTGRVDTAEDVTIDPLRMEAKWYEFSAEDEGEFAKSYKERRGRIYGSQRVNTGYDFDADVKQLAENIPFRGCVQSTEFSTAFRTGHQLISGQTPTDFPGPFLDGGTYYSATDEAEKQLLSGAITWGWRNGALDGYDLGDFPQLHGADNKAMDGSGVLLFYVGSDTSLPTGTHVSDDTAAMTDGPCWNWSQDAVTAIALLPHFSRFILDGGGNIAHSLDWGPAQETNIPGLGYASDDVGLYADFWKDYLHDRLDENTKVVTARVRLDGLRVGVDLLRRFYWWRGALWVLASVKNYSLTTFDPAECEFVQVQDKTNYTNGQY